MVSKTVCLNPREFKDYYKYLWERSELKGSIKPRCIPVSDYTKYKKHCQKRATRDAFVATINTY